METTAVETGLTFGQIEWLWALGVIPVLALLFWLAQCKRDALLKRVVAPRLREQLASGVNLPVRHFRSVLILLVVALGVVALAKPRLGYMEREIKTMGRDVILAFDVSRSMLATDTSPTRLARSKLIAQDLLRLLQGDRVGVVAFAGTAFLQAPLTLDRSAIYSTIDELDTDLIPRGGTNLGAAIQTSMDAFGKAEGIVRALVIFTDGEELDADGIAVAKRAAESGVRIFTVGIGSTEGSLIPIETADGRRDFVRDRDGKPVQSRLDSARLTEISEVTGGFYSPLDPDVARQIFSRGIEPLEESENGSMSSRVPIEQYQWPLGAAMVLFVFWLLLGEGRRKPSRIRQLARAAAWMASFAAAGSALAASAPGVDNYASGDYQAALETFEKNAAISPDRDKLQFNAGASAYQIGDFAKSIDYFTSALLTADESLRDRVGYNLANALVRRGEAAKSKDAKISDWKDAIKHYDSVLERQPDNTQAKENRDLVKKMLDDLEKQQDQQQQQDQDKKDDQQKQDQQDKKDQQDQKDQDQQKQDQKKNDDQQKQDQEQKNDQQQDQQKNDQQNQDQQQDPQKGDQSDEQKQDQNDSGDSDQQKPPSEPKDGEGKDGEQNPQEDSGEQQRQRPQDRGGDKNPTPQPTPGERKEGDLKANPDAQHAGETGEGEGEPEEREGEMSEAQARALLRSMEGEEDKVELRQQRGYQDVLRDW